MGIGQSDPAESQCAAALEEERAAAPSLLERIDGLSFAHQRMRVENEPRFWTCGFVELVLETSWQNRFDDAKAALHWAELGYLAAQRLQGYGRFAMDLLARACAYVGNAEKISSDYVAASRALRLADSYLVRGTGHPLERGRLLQISAAVAAAQDRYREAQRLLRQAITIYRQTADSQLLGAALLDQGTYYCDETELEASIRSLRQAVELLNPGQDPRLSLLAHHNLAWCLNEAGSCNEALEMQQTTLDLLRTHRIEDRLTKARFRWLQARIATNVGQRAMEDGRSPSRSFKLAEQHYKEVQEEFIAQRIGLDAAEVTVELASFYAEQRRHADVLSVALEVIQVFDAQDVSPSAAVALRLFVDAAREGAIEIEFLRQLRGYLHQVRMNPDLEFGLD